jgi:hypothetical protein
LAVPVTVISGGSVAGAATAPCENTSLPLSDEETRLFQQNNNGSIARGILSGSTLQANADTFLTGICNQPNKAAALTFVEQQGVKLWTDAVQLARGSDPDDTPLYWARIRMAAALHRLDSVPFASDREELRRTFERASRGMSTSSFDNKNELRVFISGFDPFFLDARIDRENPSATAVMRLDGQVFPMNGVNVEVQAVVFPVRFVDFVGTNFDNGLVEEIFRPKLTAGPQRADLITTVSLNPGGSVFDLETFNARRRSSAPAPDNDKKTACHPEPSPAPDCGTPANPYETPDLRATDGKDRGRAIEFNRSTLPMTAMALSGTPTVRIHDTWEQLPGGAKNLQNQPKGPTKGAKSVAGSGGPFLSNEIAYRVARLRDRLKETVPTGHVHVPDVNNFSQTQIADRYKEILLAAMGTLKPPTKKRASINGGPVDVALQTAGDTGRVFFSGQAGQQTTIQFQATISSAESSAYIVTVFNPDGTVLQPPRSGWRDERRTPLSMAQTGDYWIEIDPRERAIGWFTVQLGDPPTNTGNRLVIGGNIGWTRIGGSLTMNVNAGDQLNAEFWGSEAPVFMSIIWVPMQKLVYGPVRVDPHGWIYRFTFPFSGEYRIDVPPLFANDSGWFYMRAHPTLPDATGSVALEPGPYCGEAGRLTLNTSGQKGVMTFNGQAGQLVSVGFEGTTIFSALTTWRSPGGGIFEPRTLTLGLGAQTATYDSFQRKVLPQTGTYRLEVDGSTNNSTIGDYSAFLCDVPPDAGVTAAVNGPEVEVINTAIGQNAYFEFVGQANTLVTAIVKSDGKGLDSVRFLKPDGTPVLKDDGTPVTPGQGGWQWDFTGVKLPVDGTYRIAIDPTTNAMGGYTMTVSAVQVPPRPTSSPRPPLITRGEPNFDAYCWSQGMDGAILLGSTATDWWCTGAFTYAIGLAEVVQACTIQYGNESWQPGYESLSDPNSWQCWVAQASPSPTPSLTPSRTPTPTPTPSRTPTPTPAPTTPSGQINEGPPDFDGYCWYAGMDGAVLNGSTAEDWYCYGPYMFRITTDEVVAACLFAYGNYQYSPRYANLNDPYSWRCWRNP